MSVESNKMSGPLVVDEDQEIYVEMKVDPGCKKMSEDSAKSVERKENRELPVGLLKPAENEAGDDFDVLNVVTKRLEQYREEKRNNENAENTVGSAAASETTVPNSATASEDPSPADRGNNNDPQAADALTLERQAPLLVPDGIPGAFSAAPGSALVQNDHLSFDLLQRQQRGPAFPLSDRNNGQEVGLVEARQVTDDSRSPHHEAAEPVDLEEAQRRSSAKRAQTDRSIARQLVGGCGILIVLVGIVVLVSFFVVGEEENDKDSGITGETMAPTRDPLLLLLDPPNDNHRGRELPSG